MEKNEMLTMANVMFVTGFMSFICAGIYLILKSRIGGASVSPILGFINIVPIISIVMMVIGLVLYYRYFVRKNYD